MSAVTNASGDANGLRERWSRAVATALRAIVGDRMGSVVLLAGLLVGTVFWQVGVVINDNYTLVNALVAVSEGHLHFERIVAGRAYSPGTHLVDGRVYGRNYGQVVLALPFLWALEAVAAVADLRLSVFALAGLLVVALGVQIGRLTDRERAGILGGSALGLAVFGANAVLATPLPTDRLPQMALQLQSIVAAGLAGVVLYRLVGALHGRRAGGFAGLVLVAATPIAYWSHVPKRHVLSTLTVMAVVYAFYRSRTAGSTAGERRYRAAAYAITALLAWVVAPEAGVLALALVAVDLPTARSNDLRSLGTIGVACAVAALPFLITNWLISGNPILPPRFLPSAPVGPGVSLTDLTGGTATGASATGATGADAASDSGGSGPGASGVLGRFVEGVVVAAREPDRLVGTFLRSGYVERRGTGATNLTVLESAPVLGGLLALPVLAARRVAGAGRPRPSELLARPARATDALVVLVALLFVAIYLPSLPLRVQFTVRYLLPVYALGLYGIVRLGAVRAVLDRGLATLAWTVVGTVVLGGQLVVAWLGITNPELTRATALQFHALLGVASGLVLAGYVAAVALGRRGGRPSAWSVRVGGVALGLAVGTGAVLVVLGSLLYFASTDLLAFPALRHLAALLERL